MDVPFDVTKYENDLFYKEIVRFNELYKKFADDVDDALEFAELFHILVVRQKRFKWK